MARSFVEGVPALVLAALSPYTLASVFFRPDGITARVFPPGAVTEDYRPGMSEALRDPFGFSILLAVLAVALLPRLRLRWRPLGFLFSLLASDLAVVLMQPISRGFGWRSADPDWLRWLSVVVGIGLAIPAFRALAAETGIPARGVRMLAVTAMVLAPPLVFASLFGRGGLSIQTGWSLLLPLPLALIASYSVRRDLLAPWRNVGLRLACGGAAASFALMLVGTAPRQPATTRMTAPDVAAPQSAAQGPYQKLFFQRGVSFTSEWPDSYESPKAHDLLRKLKDRGVDAIALVPYGTSSASSGELRYGHWERDDSILALTATAHNLGMRVMLKPQVWIRGSYPGDFDLPEESMRAAWLAQYEKFALHHAELANRTHADVFCIGTEFAKLTVHEAFWRQLIARIRKVYSGPITYAANFGSEFETISFWDELDYIGLNNYYPLPDSLDPQAVVAKVEAVQQRFGKPILLTEGGYSSYAGGHRKPWSENEGPVDLEMQAKAYDAVLAAFWEKPWFYGAYWWKVGSNAFGGPLDRSHTPWGKPAMQVLSHWYSKPTPPRSMDKAPPAGRR
ncbi:MAG: hypothetical protein U5J83_05745 [Bryobacterales bacterium]|nr:hypothetical protein [Bryobacterales bacterium]